MPDKYPCFHRRQQGYALSLDPQTVCAFDAEGRPIWIWRDGVGYQRGLSGQTLSKSRDPQGVKHRRTLSADERLALWQWLESTLAALPKTADLDRLQAWTPERLEAAVTQFGHIYRPVSILPPDQYSAIVLQAAEGCSWNRCSFCNFYKDRRFRIKDSAEFGQHLQAVKSWLGRAADSRHSLFLADGDALMIPQARLLALLAQARTVFPGRPWYSFMDAFRPGAKSTTDYAELARQGLRRVYLGLETGHAPLLKLLNKPGTPAEMRAEIVRLKAAGLQVGLILMTGVGGREMAQAHVNDSLALLADLPLDRQDLIYLSAFVTHPDQPYVQLAAAAGLTDLTPAEQQRQCEDLRVGLAHSGAQVAAYHLLEYVY